MEIQNKSEEIFNGKVIRVSKDEVIIDDGTIAYREVVKHNGGVCIALKNGDYYYMVRQYRYPMGEMMLEFPAGKIEKDEDPDLAIIREAQEETGFTVKNIMKFGYVVPTCGYSNEKIYLYYGEADKNIGQHLDKDERINVEKYTLNEIEQMIMNNEIQDAKTIALVLHIKLKGLDA